jgi:hypothetical protein
MTRYVLLFLLLGGAVDCRLANAQGPFTCGVDTNQFLPTVRAEGLAELVGDVFVTCIGGTPVSAGAPIPAYDMTLSFNAKVTSRILGTDGVTSYSEALVLLDEPSANGQYPCEQTNGVCQGHGNSNLNNYYGVGPLNRNIFQGVVGAGNTLVWKAIPVDPLGDTGRISFRFTNIRLDATSLTGGATDLTMTSIRINNTTNPAVTIPAPTFNLDGSIVVASAQPSLTATVRDAANAVTSASAVTLPVSAAVNQARVATLRFAGTFFEADKARTAAPYSDADSSPTPANQNDVQSRAFGAILGTETGFYNASFGSYGVRGNLGTAGLADSGTRYMAVINHIPDGFSVYVDVYNSTGAAGPTARLINVDASGAGTFVAAAPGSGNKAQLTVIGGKAVAVWEVLRTTQDPGTYDFGVYLSYPAGTTAPVSTDIQMMYAPTGGHATPPTSAIPVFDGTAASQNLFTYSLSAVPLPDPGTPAPTPTPTPTGTPASTSPMTVLPLTMSFKATVGGQNPPPQFLQISSSGMPMGFSITSGGIIPLQPLPSDGVTYRLVNISVDTTGMTASDTPYQDTLTVTNTVDGAVFPVAVTFTLNAAPQISTLGAPSVQAGAPGFTLTVNGSNFTSLCTIRWNAKALPTTYVSAGQLKAQVPASLLAATGPAAITVSTSDGAVSQPVSLAVENLAISSLSPARATAGDPGFTLTITGSGFPAGATVTFAGTVLPATSVTATQIVAAIPANLIAKEGAIPVSVSSPGGSVSNSLSFTVGPVFLISALSPSVVMVGGPSFTLEVSGAGFVGGTTVQVGTVQLRPNSLAADKIVVTILAGMIVQAGPLPVSVLRPDLPPSNSLTLTVSALPAITALDPPSVTVKSPSFTLTVAGVGFLPGATVRWNAQALATTLVSSTQLTALVPAELVASLGSALIDVSTGGNGFSSAVMIRINVPGPPTLTSVSPAAVPVGTAASITLTGTGFASGCAVVFTPPSGAAVRVVTNSCSPTQVVVRLPASVLGTPGPGQLQVTNPDGLSSPAMPITVGLPPFPDVSFLAPLSVPSGQDLRLSLSLNGSYPVTVQGTLTMTFTADGDLPDDPSIQFQNGSRVYAFSIPAGTQPEIQVAMKSGTVAGLIAITPAFTSGGQDMTPAGGLAQQIQIARAAPSVTLFTCTRTPSGFLATVEGFTNTRAATQASFDLQSASGDSLGTADLGANAPLLFSGWFGSDQAAASGGLFRYTQTFTTVVDASKIAAATVKLSNAIGTSTTASCQLQ